MAINKIDTKIFFCDVFLDASAEGTCKDKNSTRPLDFMVMLCTSFSYSLKLFFTILSIFQSFGHYLTGKCPPECYWTIISI